MKSLSDKAGFLILANLIKYSVGFIMPMVLVRLFSQTEYGTYQQLILVSTAAVGIMTLGVPTSVYYFFHHVSAERRSTLIVQTTLLVAAGGLVAGAAVFFGADFIARNLTNPSLAALLPLYAVSIVFTVASEHSIAFIISQNRFKLAVLFETVEIFLRLFLLLVPLRLGYGIWGVVMGLVVFAVLRWVGRNGYLFLRSGVKFAGWSKGLFVGEQMAYSAPVALVSVSSMFGNTFNKGIIAASFSPAQYAVYAVGSFPIPLSTIFQASVADVLRSSLPPLVRDGNLAEVARVVREASRKLSMIVLPGFVFLFAFAEQLITLAFTTKYRDSVDIFRIFILSVPLDMLILSAIPQVFGRTRLNFYINLSTMAVLVVLSYVPAARRGLLWRRDCHGPVAILFLHRVRDRGAEADADDTAAAVCMGSHAAGLPVRRRCRGDRPYGNRAHPLALPGSHPGGLPLLRRLPGAGCRERRPDFAGPHAGAALAREIPAGRRRLSASAMSSNSHDTANMGRPLTVAHVLLSLEPGGLENGVVNVVNRLDAGQFRSQVCCLKRAGEFAGRLQGPVGVHALGWHGGNDPKLLFRLAGLFRRLRPDIVHTRNAEAFFYGFLAAKLAGVPAIVHSEHGRTFDDRPLRFLAQRVLSRGAAAIFAVSEQLKRDLVTHVGIPASRIDVLYNGVDLGRFDASQRDRVRGELGIGANELVVGSVGRLVPVKNYPLLLRAVHRLGAGQCRSAAGWRRRRAGRARGNRPVPRLRFQAAPGGAQRAGATIDCRDGRLRPALAERGYVQHPAGGHVERCRGRRESRRRQPGDHPGRAGGVAVRERR